MNKYTVGGVILGIFLLASAGIRSAVNWLSSSTPETSTQDRVLSADDTRIRSNPNNAQSSSSSQNDADRLNSQSDGIFNDQTISQADRGIDDSSAQSANDDPIDAPLEKAGTYVQRQKRVEEDSIIAATDVNVIPTADPSAVAAQGNTTVNPQPTAPEPASTDQTTPATATTSSPSAPAAVPALW